MKRNFRNTCAVSQIQLKCYRRQLCLWREGKLNLKTYGKEANHTLQNPASLNKQANSLHTKTLWSFIPVCDLLRPLDQQTGTKVTGVVMQSFCAHGHQKAPGRTGAQLLPCLHHASWRGELPHHAPGHFSQVFMQLGLSLGEALRAR